MSDFVTLALTGGVLLEEIDDFVDEWHRAPNGLSLSDFLGMTSEEYALWVQQPDMLSHIIRARYKKIPLIDVIEEDYEHMRIAARLNDPAKIKRLRQWLANTKQV
jgi:hypothetical protein